MATESDGKHQEYQRGEVGQIGRYQRELDAVEIKAGLWKLFQANQYLLKQLDLLATLRRKKLARTRAAKLGLPGIAPQELVASMNAMTTTLEGKHASLATRLNLLRLSPELIVPSEAGLNTSVATLETEARRMGTEEDVRTSRSGTGTEDYQYTVAAQLKGKGKGREKGKAAESQDARRVCWYFGTEKGCDKGKDCPFKHVRPSAGNADRTGKPSSTDTGNAKALAAATAKEAKAKAKAKAKAEAKGPRNQSTEDVSNDEGTYASVRLLQRKQAAETETVRPSPAHVLRRRVGRHGKVNRSNVRHQAECANARLCIQTAATAPSGAYVGCRTRSLGRKWSAIQEVALG
ncbi:hypothetical protein AK812_SmicGene3 [Symbiodinium microadriaticum]|uniref:C3H1-type domain-containing protein n=1 Tax=Symbiodinium microadriaticum TaxID=2951 RepID=A0A1Q9F7N4_SYMMI|nr:hypothetical protein AK812_SmicGene3 [Symbiodinium microadriaticum]